VRWLFLTLVAVTSQDSLKVLCKTTVFQGTPLPPWVAVYLLRCPASYISGKHVAGNLGLVAGGCLFDGRGVCDGCLGVDVLGLMTPYTPPTSDPPPSLSWAGWVGV
jgi:hypothetical protein